ncbi:Ulp1 family isopeptidase [Rickettsia endosymbiont of Oedothorax gibbosus]|uniref:Ulp1 family isopeptidase n=1 Tax=Rickettsia endosymbiont of Oedothorax gibbosus TaxID=931099 RepID=UPI00202551C8|nr:Ulp1 family isopeptidase [Rickettsia endosymbiont of Oedothorax gibbosus]
MSLAKEGENNVVLFNIGGSHESQEIQHSTNMSKISSAISTIELKPHMQDGKLDKENIVSEIFDKAENLGKTPILNIQFNSNMEKPLFDEDDLTNLKNLGVKVCLTFSNYNSQAQNLQSSWQPLLTGVNHVFFANDNDQIRAVAEKHVAKEKTSHIQSMPVSNLIESEILNRPPNILLSGGLPNKERLTEVVKAAKDLGNTRVIIASNPSSIDDVANIIANKFDIINEDQQLGIKLEVEEILKDKVGGAKKLENYISQLSQQFQKDIGRTEINPIDIYFDLSEPQKLQNLAKQAKYTVPLQQGYTIENFTNGCIPLGQGQGRSSDITAEVKQREAVPGINSVTVHDMQENLNEYKPENVLKRVINAFKQMANEGRKAIPIPTKQNKVESSQENNLTKENYWYNDLDISNLLKASLNENVSIQPAVSLAFDQYNNEILRHVMLEAIASVNNSGKDSAVMPINTGHEHWVSLAITKDKDDKTVFTYNDPMGTEIEQRSKLVEVIKEICPDNAKIVDLKTKQQENDKDCGPFIVDNLIKMAKGKKILTTEQSQDMGAKLREGQAETINIEKIKQKARSMREIIGSTSTTLSTTSCRPSTSLAIKSNSRPRGNSI